MFDAMKNRVDLSSPLSILEPGQKGIVLRLSSDGDLRGKLRDLGFTAGTCVTCLDASFDDFMTVSIGGHSFAIPRDESATVWLRLTHD
jgi:Fe2+ transport system protein FeoA